MNTLQIIQNVFGNNEVSEKWLEKQYEFAAAIAATEREECAKVCDAHRINGQLVHSNAVVGCAAAIRARGQQ